MDTPSSYYNNFYQSSIGNYQSPPTPSMGNDSLPYTFDNFYQNDQYETALLLEATDLLMRDLANCMKSDHEKSVVFNTKAIVSKNVTKGPRGGRYYISPQSGRKVWLNRKKKIDCMNGYVPGAGRTCPGIP